VWSGVATPNKDKNSASLVQAKLMPLGAKTQIVNGAAAVKLLAVFEQFYMPVDAVYQHWWHHVHRGFIELDKFAHVKYKGRVSHANIALRKIRRCYLIEN
jgi:hypothetical protein